MRKLVCGIAINDAEYKTKIAKWESGKSVIEWECQIYKMWSRMIQRCYSKSALKNRPSYGECSICDDWLIFSGFRKWIGEKDISGLALDKDLLVSGNKVYSPNTCLLVSKTVNSFMVDRASDRGEWPIGASLDRESGLFVSHCSNPFTKKNEYLGRYKSAQDAHEAWRARKHQIACQLAQLQTDQEVAFALRLRYAKAE